MKTYVQILKHQKPRARMHAVDCTWVAGIEATQALRRRQADEYVVVEVTPELLARHEHCSRC